MTASISPASTFSWTGLGSALSCLLPQSLTSSQRSYSLAINGSLQAFFQVFLGMSVVSLLLAEGLNYCVKDPFQGGFTIHQISRSHRRCVRRFRNTWLLMAQLCWLFLTDIPGQLTNSTYVCQLCGALTHLFWMLFWFSTGEIQKQYCCFIHKFAKPRRGGYFPCLCNEQCNKYFPPLLTPFRWNPTAFCHGGRHLWIFY